MRAKSYISMALVVVSSLFLESCAEFQGSGRKVQAPTSDECLERAIRAEIDTKGYYQDAPVMVSTVNDGAVRLNVPSAHDGTISD